MTAETTDETTEATDETTGATAAKRGRRSRRTSNKAVASNPQARRHSARRSSGTVPHCPEGERRRVEAASLWRSTGIAAPGSDTSVRKDLTTCLLTG
jgi:hypothetical protein